MEIAKLVKALPARPGLAVCGLGERRELIYPALFSAALGGDAQGLLLVPDLGFIPALAAALEPVFPGRVGVWHARLTPKKRAEAWAGAFAGKYKVMIATRSGVFLAFKNLPLGLLDGEDEEVYRLEEAEPFLPARSVLLNGMTALGGRKSVG